MSSHPRRHRFRVLGCIALVVLALALARPAVHLLGFIARDTDELTPLPAGWVDDASRLNRTQVAEVWIGQPEGAAYEAQLARVLVHAQAEGLRVSVAGARHSMGGHSFYPGGVVLDMLPHKRMELDQERDLLKVQSGALWSDVIPYLDAHGRSVQVMQSDNSFSVGGSISVNCHGWQVGYPPIASTVDAFRLMLADGSIVRCSRMEQPELFSLALGGYGLFGVILDVDLRVAVNERYRVERHVLPLNAALSTLEEELLGRPGVEMVYGRMNVDPDAFLEDVVLSVCVSDPSGPVPALAAPSLPALRRAIFRGSEESDYGKRLRWNAETHLQRFLSSSICSRNQLLNESVLVFQNRSNASTDILHEYFVPPDRVEEFVQAARRLIPLSQVDLLNVTLRMLNEDQDSFLRYADRPLIALVMLFTQDRNPGGEARMQALTEALIEASLACGGRYYLPYRLHATQEQFHAAYPRAGEFFDLKRKYDPDELFQNHFYLKYGTPH